jgi:mono/diheme cytochrome c family protein
MERRFIPIVTFVTILFLASSCYYDNEEALYPSLNTSCDTTNVTFSATITAILANNCFSCHSNATASAGNNIRLEIYADVKARTTAITGSLKHTGGYSPMPKNGGKLKACSITQFDIWVRNGAPNN